MVSNCRDFGDVCPLLDVDDMVKMKKPDWKCVFTYVQSFYRRFRNGRERQPSPRKLNFNVSERGKFYREDFRDDEDSQNNNNNNNDDLTAPLRLPDQHEFVLRTDAVVEPFKKFRNFEIKPLPQTSFGGRGGGGGLSRPLEQNQRNVLTRQSYSLPGPRPAFNRPMQPPIPSRPLVPQSSMVVGSPPQTPQTPASAPPHLGGSGGGVGAGSPSFLFRPLPQTFGNEPPTRPQPAFLPQQRQQSPQLFLQQQRQQQVMGAASPRTLHAILPQQQQQQRQLKTQLQHASNVLKNKLPRESGSIKDSCYDPKPQLQNTNNFYQRSLLRTPDNLLSRPTDINHNKDDERTILHPSSQTPLLTTTIDRKTSLPADSNAVSLLTEKPVIFEQTNPETVAVTKPIPIAVLSARATAAATTGTNLGQPGFPRAATPTSPTANNPPRPRPPTPKETEAKAGTSRLQKLLDDIPRLTTEDDADSPQTSKSNLPPAPKQEEQKQERLQDVSTQTEGAEVFFTPPQSPTAIPLQADSPPRRRPLSRSGEHPKHPPPRSPSPSAPQNHSSLHGRPPSGLSCGGGAGRRSRTPSVERLQRMIHLYHQQHHHAPSPIPPPPSLPAPQLPPAILSSPRLPVKTDPSPHNLNASPSSPPSAFYSQPPSPPAPSSVQQRGGGCGIGAASSPFFQPFRVNPATFSGPVRLRSLTPTRCPSTKYDHDPSSSLLSVAPTTKRHKSLPPMHAVPLPV